MPTTSNHHVALRVADVERASDFYVEVFGAARSLDEPMYIEGEVAEMTVSGPAGTKLTIQMLEFPDGGSVELFEFGEPVHPTAPIDAWRAAQMHFAIQVDDVEGTLAKALAAGAEQVWPEVLEMGPLRIVYIQDGDGNVIELINSSMGEMVTFLRES
jgi:catechol 2,3-dioxygenase-like lactoylglutathione lyase family enzyme